MPLDHQPALLSSCGNVTTVEIGGQARVPHHLVRPFHSPGASPWARGVCRVQGIQGPEVRTQAQRHAEGFLQFETPVPQPSINRGPSRGLQGCFCTRINSGFLFATRPNSSCRRCLRPSNRSSRMFLPICSNSKKLEFFPNLTRSDFVAQQFIHGHHTFTCVSTHQ